MSIIWLIIDYSFVSDLIYCVVLRFISAAAEYCTLGSLCSRRLNATVKSRKVKGKRKSKTRPTLNVNKKDSIAIEKLENFCSVSESGNIKCYKKVCS